MSKNRHDREGGIEFDFNSVFTLDICFIDADIDLFKDFVRDVSQGFFSSSAVAQGMFCAMDQRAEGPSLYATPTWSHTRIWLPAWTLRLTDVDWMNTSKLPRSPGFRRTSELELMPRS